MAYVPGFEWDIFISYPRESDERDALDFEWVNEFHRILQKELNERIPHTESPKVYFDRRHFGAAKDLEHDLLEAARKSALLVAIVSPKFVAPGKFTLKELDAFCKSGDAKRRIVVVELLPVTREDGRPDTLEGPKRNPFYVREEGRPIKLSPRSEKYGDEYATRLQIVAEDIKDVLQEMRRSAGGAVKETTKPFSGKAVLLAEREEDVEREWEDIRAYLRDYGAEVVPAEGKYPESESDFSSALASDLEKADLFVQLLSPLDEANHWVELEGKPTRASLHYQAVTSGARKMPVLQWRKPIAIKPQALRHWDKDLLEGPHVIALGIEEFKREIKKKLLELIAPPPSVQIAAAATKPYVYITADDPDIDLAFELKDLTENKLKLTDNCEIIAAEDRMDHFKETIKVTDIIVFLYGKGSPEFVNRWLSQYAKLKATGLAKPPKVEVLYRAPPPKTDIRQRLRAPLGSFLPLGSESEVSLEGMQKVFEELERKRNTNPGAAST